MNKTSVGVVIIAPILMVALTAALVSGIGFSLAQVRRTFGALDPQTAILLATACLTVLLAAWLVAAAIRTAKQREIASIAARHRGQLYAAVLEAFASNLVGTGLEKPAVLGALALHAGIPVLKEYQAAVRVLSGPTPAEDAARQQIDRLILAMRRDLGVPTFGWESNLPFDWLNRDQPSASSRNAGHSSTPPAAPDRPAPEHRIFPEA